MGRGTRPVPMTLGEEPWVCAGSGREPGLSRKPPDAGSNLRRLPTPICWNQLMPEMPTCMAFAHDNSRLALNE